MVFRKRVPLVAILVLLGLCISFAYWAPTTPVRASWTYPSGFDPHGGYIDQWIWSLHYEHQAWGLQSGLIDGINEPLHPDDMSALEMLPDIEIHTGPSLRFRYCQFNCQQFPTNITGYRRAIAYAFDKQLACDEAVNGLAEPLDGMIPPSLSWWTYENEISEHFYSKDIANANASLEAAWFRDLDGDGWREYDTNNNSLWDSGVDIDDGGSTYNPNNPGCHIQLLTSASSSAAMNTMEVIKSGMTECGLRGSVRGEDFNTVRYLGFFGMYNLLSMSWNHIPPWHPEFLYNIFHSEHYWNSATVRYNNSDYDQQAEAMMEAPTYEDAKQCIWNCSQILLDDMPMIICYNDLDIHAYRTDRWTGYVNMTGLNVMGMNPWTPTSVRLKESAGGPFGCAPTRYTCALGHDILEHLNVIEINTVWEKAVFEMIYDHLWEIDAYTWEKSPLIARNWTIEETLAAGDIQAGQKFTFHLFNNITWHDGTPLTSEDVAYSLGTIWPCSGMFYKNVANIYKIDTPDNHTVVIYTNSSGYFEFTLSTNPFILPKHIWEPQNDPETNYTYWVPSQPIDFTGSGPFKWVVYVPGQYLVLDRYEDWHFGVEFPPRTLCPMELLPRGLVVFGVAVFVIIDIAIVYYFLKQRRQG